MATLPFPTFDKLPVSSYHNLSAVGRCRISPASLESTVYPDVLSKCLEHANLSSSSSVTSEKEEKEKKTALKKLYKQAVGNLASYFSSTLNLDPSVVDVQVSLPSKDVIDSDGLIAIVFLDAGASHIVLDGENVDAMQRTRIPTSRLVAHFSSLEYDENTFSVAKQYASTVSVHFSKENLTFENVAKVLSQSENSEEWEGFKTIIQFVPSELNFDDPSTTKLAEFVGQICEESKGGAFFSLIDPTSEELGLSFLACCKTDRPDGLYTTVVCTRNGEALGLVYSAKVSVIASLEGPRAVYYSRSRGGLWRKGDTSGRFQILHRIDTDCDGDALRFMVTQMGDLPAFCHLNTLTCWGRPFGVRRLEETLVDRMKLSPEGSYTKRLFEDEELLRDKLVEEAQELSEADNKQHVAEELADVLYFAMVRAVKAGVSIDDAVRELDKKARKVTRRKGDSKQFRIEAGNDILKKKEK